MNDINKIVVGVDGSHGSVVALRWAADEARRRDAALFPVAASPPPLLIYPYGSSLAASDPQHLDIVRAELDATLIDVLGSELDIKVVPAAMCGNPAKILIDLSGEADLLVVGSRGHGGFAGKLLGSVSRDVATHAACTVVIARDRG